MGFKCGIIGLPNIGKSTLFNALTQTSQAQAENYPFCTIEPNIGEVDVPDARLNQLSIISSSLFTGTFLITLNVFLYLSSNRSATPWLTV